MATKNTSITRRKKASISLAEGSEAQPLEVPEVQEPAEVGAPDNETDASDSASNLENAESASPLPGSSVPAPAKGYDDNLVQELPEEVLAFLVRSTPSRPLWELLNRDDHIQVLHTISRGFQRTANVLRQPVVRNRLINHLYDHLTDFMAVLRLWGEASPPPQVISEMRLMQDDEDLVEQLPDLWQRHGIEALLLALLLDDRRTAIEALDRIVERETDREVAEAELNDAADKELNRRQGETRRSIQRRALLRRRGRRRDEDPDENDERNLLNNLAIAREWQERAGKAEADLQNAQNTLTSTQTTLSETREQLRVMAQAHKRELHQAQAKATSSETQLQETKKLLDRTTRRLKSLQRESEDLTADDKRLKRQLRRQQQLNEELRKQLANTTAKLQSLASAAEATSKITPAPATEDKKAAPGATHADKTAPQPVLVPRQAQLSPLDQVFIWQSDGRQFRVAPREVKRAIDRNDEDFVFTLIQAFDVLRETNEPGYRMFLDRIREFDRYYSRVLTVDTTRVLVDASNVVRYESNRYGKGQLRHLLAMRDELRRRDCFPIMIYADASLPYHIDEPAEFMKLVKSGEVQMTTSGQEADELLAREARRTGAYVVTNDRSFHTKVSPDFEPPRITFRIHDGFLIVDDF